MGKVFNNHLSSQYFDSVGMEESLESRKEEVCGQDLICSLLVPARAYIKPFVSLLHSTPFPSIKQAPFLSPLFTCPPDFILPSTLSHTPDNLTSLPWSACVFSPKITWHLSSSWKSILIRWVKVKVTSAHNKI